MIGETIREARKAKSLGLREVARQMEFTPSYLSDIEHDRRVPAEDVLHRLAALLGLDGGELMVQAGRLGAECEAYIKRQPEAMRLIRCIAQANLDADELKALTRFAGLEVR